MLRYVALDIYPEDGSSRFVRLVGFYHNLLRHIPEERINKRRIFLLKVQGGNSGRSLGKQCEAKVTEFFHVLRGLLTPLQKFSVILNELQTSV
jgi:hypothetical protein